MFILRYIEVKIRPTLTAGTANSVSWGLIAGTANSVSWTLIAEVSMNNDSQYLHLEPTITKLTFHDNDWIYFWNSYF